MGAAPFNVGNLPVRFKTWRLEEEVPDIQSFDIGLMPLTDDEETRGKCGFKLIQYMSCGVPAVSSPVGANLSIIEHGASGFFASTLAQWQTHIGDLIADTPLRQRMGREGRAVACLRYSLAVQAPRLANIIKSVAHAA